MGNDENINKTYSPKAMYTRFLMIWIPFLLIGFILLFFAGVAYLLLWILLFHLIITSAVFIPGIGQFMVGKHIYQMSHEPLIKMGKSRRYKIYWVVSNMFWIAATTISFNYNLRVIDFF